ncbi:MAG: hypothetical protein HYS41_05535 [Candidatus Omnitrophica bacterium]|nr:hypothetical protein [Candidatus Omnitrophota bacterium]
MNEEERLDRLLQGAYPMVSVSPDFTLRLWKRLMGSATRPPWMIPVPVAAFALALGIFLGFWTGTGQRGFSNARLDLFGNAPYDSVSGSYLKAVYPS